MSVASFQQFRFFQSLLARGSFYDFLAVVEIAHR